MIGRGFAVPSQKGETANRLKSSGSGQTRKVEQKLFLANSRVPSGGEQKAVERARDYVPNKNKARRRKPPCKTTTPKRKRGEGGGRAKAQADVYRWSFPKSTEAAVKRKKKILGA